MNGNDILRAMNGLDERFIVSAKRGMTVKRRGLGKRWASIAAGIAAAAVLAVPAAAYAYTQLVHHAAVQEYFSEKSVEYLEEHGLALNYTDENEHIRLTVDTLLSDGHIGGMILTIEGLDEKGLECVQMNTFPEIYLTDAQTSEYVKIHENGSPQILGGGNVYFDACTETQFTLWTELQLDKIDTDKDYILKFGMNTARNSSEYETVHNEYGILTDNVMEGISFKTSLRPNVAVKELESENGEKIWLSQIGYYSNEQIVISKMRNHFNEIRLLMENSILKDKVEVIAQSLDWSPERSQPLGCGWFDSIVEIDKYKGVEIGETKYIETE
ncbi:MAG: hypothetical protein J1E40_11060 [Oscillospiraceae bacterium]|nr:hypothetical protein [Oscillospiraceae bacterium]